MLLIEGETAHDVFDVVEVNGTLVRARSAFLYEIGEELRVRIERGGQTSDVQVRVRGHAADGAGKITELELVETA